MTHMMMHRNNSTVAGMPAAVALAIGFLSQPALSQSGPEITEDVRQESARCDGCYVYPCVAGPESGSFPIGSSFAGGLGVCDTFDEPEQCDDLWLFNYSGQQPGEQGSRLSDPVSLSFSDFHQQHVDLVIPGIGMDFVFKRTYRSRSGSWSKLYEMDDWADDGIWFNEPLIEYDPGNVSGERRHGIYDIARQQPLGMNWQHSFNIRAYAYLLPLFETMPEHVYDPDTENGTTDDCTTAPNDYETISAFNRLGPAEIVILNEVGRIDRYAYVFSGDDFPVIDLCDPQSPSYGMRSQESDGIFRFERAGRHDFIEIVTNAPTPGVAGVGAIDNYLGQMISMKMYRADGTVLEFDNDSGLVKTITDRNGNFIEIQSEVLTTDDSEQTAYNANPGSVAFPANGRPSYRVSKVIDTRGEEIEFFYHDDVGSPMTGTHPGAGRRDREHLLWKIEHAGRTVEYDYEFAAWGPTPGLNAQVGPYASKAKLITATLPKIDASGTLSGISEHARFPNGRVWRYGYQDEFVQGDSYDDTGNPVGSGGTTFDSGDAASIYWAGQMTSVVSPNGDIVTENEWFLPVAERTGTDYRLSRQAHGGAAYNYAYTFASASSIPDVDWPWEQPYYVWVNTRRGQITRLMYQDSVNRRLINRRDYVNEASSADAASYESGSSWVNGPDGAATYYETVYTNNADWHVTNQVLPNGDEVITAYFEGATEPTLRGAVTARSVINGSTGAVARTEQWAYTYDLSGMGAACGGCGSSDFSTGYADGNVLNPDGPNPGAGNLSFTAFDVNGNVIARYHGVPDGAGGLSVDSDPILEKGTIEQHALAIEEFEYNDPFNRITKKAHPGRLVIDPSTGATSTYFQADTYEYHPSTAAGGNAYRLSRVVVDSGGLALATEYEYDIYGNVSKVTSPEGRITTYLYNQANELVRTMSWDIGMTKPYARTDFFYDANGNMVVEEVTNYVKNQAIDSQNVVLTTIHQYDELDYLVATWRESGVVTAPVSYDLSTGPNGEGPSNAAMAPSGPALLDWVGTQHVYDEARNRITTRYGEAVNGSQPYNQVDYVYDERDQLIAVHRGGDFHALSPVPGIHVTSYTYDANGRLLTTTVAPGSAEPRVSTRVYDALNRVTKTIDPMGNETRMTYGPVLELAAVARHGPLTSDTTTAIDAEHLLAYQEYTYDTMLRRISTRTAAFEYDFASPATILSAVPSGDLEWETTSTYYNNDSSVFEVHRDVTDHTDIDSDGDTSETVQAITRFSYDGAGRRNLTIDPAGNLSQMVFDKDSNVTSTTRTDRTALSGGVDQIYNTAYTYDALDRRTETLLGSESGGVQNRTVYHYDSRGNLIEVVDPRNNMTAYTYDAMSRRIKTTRFMTENGFGSGAADTVNPEIITQTVYDDSSRVIELIDDNGNVTEYDYDALNRETARWMPSSGTPDPGGGTYNEVYQTRYDIYGNAYERVDARGVIVADTFDRNNRMTRRDIDDSVHPIPGAKLEQYTYDGLGRMRTARSEHQLDELPVALPEVGVMVYRIYDSRSNLVQETTNADATANFPASSDRSVTSAYDIGRNETLTTYSGGRVIGRGFDPLGQISGVYEGPTASVVATFKYVGPFREEQRAFGNGVVTTYGYSGYAAYSPAGNQGFGHTESITATHSAHGTIDARAFTWDEAGNRLTHDDLGSNVDRRHRSFEYDSANRLVSSATMFPHSGTTLTGGETDYTLDGVHNRTVVALDTIVGGNDWSGAPLGSYLDPTDTGRRAKNNQYTTTPGPGTVNGPSQWLHEYDKNGNMTVQMDPCPTDFNQDGALDVLDAAAFLAVWNAYPDPVNGGDPRADFNGDGNVDVLDVSDFNSQHGGAADRSCEVRTFAYDYRDQLIETTIYDGAELASKSTHTYDALKRRTVEENLAAPTRGAHIPYGLRRYVYGGVSRWEIIEELDARDNAAALMMTRVPHGQRIDDELSHTVEGSSRVDYYSHRDDMNTLYATTDDQGSVVERYDYGDYGEVRFLDPAGAPLAPVSGAVFADTGVEARSLYTGRRPMPYASSATSMVLVDYRHRVMDTYSGRFVQRDPLEYVDSLNQFAIAISNPIAYIDPFGLACSTPGARPKSPAVSFRCRDKYEKCLATSPQVRAAFDRYFEDCAGVGVPDMRIHCYGPRDDDSLGSYSCRRNTITWNHEKSGCGTLAHEVLHAADYCKLDPDCIEAGVPGFEACAQVMCREARSFAMGSCCDPDHPARKNKTYLQCLIDRRELYLESNGAVNSRCNGISKDSRRVLWTKCAPIGLLRDDAEASYCSGFIPPIERWWSGG